MRSLIVAAVVMTLTIAPAGAQDKYGNPPAQDKNSNPPQNPKPSKMEDIIRDPSTNQINLPELGTKGGDDFYDEQKKHQIWVYQFRRNIYEWQHRSSQIVFLVANVIVLVGLYMSVIYFNRWKQTAVFQASPVLETPQAASPDNGSEQMAGANLLDTHKMKLSPSGLEVTSPVLGIVMLALSLGFYYMYLAYVYPITK